jgi:acyl dehydratase
MTTHRITLEEEHADLIDVSLAEAEQLIGVWLRRDVHGPVNYEPISAHDIRRWALFSTGDDNPLFTSEEYGRRGPYGTMIAQPTFLYTIDSTIVAPGLPGVQWIHGGNSWEFFRPVRVGDTIRAQARLRSVEEKRGKHVPRFLIQVGEVLFHNQHDQLVGRSLCRILRVPRARSGQGLKGFEPRAELPVYSAEQIDEIARAYADEQRRGAEPRYWEDVNIGDAIGPLVKGPLTMVDIVAFYAGRRYVYPPLKLAFEQRRSHPANVYTSRVTGIPMHPAAGHFDPEIAKEIGMPGAYDQGFMRVNWISHLLTNWSGDHAWISRLDVSNRLPNVVGDTCWCEGSIVAKSRKGPRAEVECELWARNQRGERVSRGTATVLLPSREVGPVASAALPFAVAAQEAAGQAEGTLLCGNWITALTCAHRTRSRVPPIPARCRSPRSATPRERCATVSWPSALGHGPVGTRTTVCRSWWSPRGRA